MRDEMFAVNAVQMIVYDPCAIIGFEAPKQYGLRQSIADTLGGGVMRALMTIPALKNFVRDSAQV
jgi:alpha-galactosidase